MRRSADSPAWPLGSNAGSSGARLPLREAIANSCNTALISARAELDDGDVGAHALADCNTCHLASLRSIRGGPHGTTIAADMASTYGRTQPPEQLGTNFVARDGARSHDPKDFGKQHDR